MFASNANNNVSEPPEPGTTLLVGQDSAGHWVVMKPDGLSGGIFVNRKAAMHYAGFECGHRPGAVRLMHERVELKL